VARSRAILVVLCACGSSSHKAIDAPNPDAAVTPSKLVAYVSGYGPDLGVYEVAPTGGLSSASTTTAFAASPSFLAIAPGGSTLYAVSEASNGRVAAYSIDAATGGLAYLDDVSSGGAGPAHVSVDRSGSHVLVANYDDGTISVLPIVAGGRLGTASQTLAAGANAHMILTDPSNRYVFVPCLGSDYVAQYLFDETSGALAPNAVPHVATAANAGPRHLAFAPDGKHAYLINERASTMTALELDAATGRLTELQTLSTRPAGATGANTTAEVWVHPSGKFLYGSNRGDDTIVQFAIDATGRLSLVGHTPTQGQTPRDFTLDPAGTFLYVANQGSNSVVPFAIDATTGTLSPTASPITAQVPTFIGLVALPQS